jgi:IS30 family transposase
MANKTGRPKIELTSEQKAQVEALASVLTQEQIADYLGICRRTFNNIIERDEEVYAQYKKGKAKAIASVAGNLVNKARNGDTTASIFYLKTQAGWREQEPEDRELPPIQVYLNDTN